ncbi:hypothetical protein BDF14DRAFT_1998141 [Spinellus fusiger]|nr:hypothetical protein BDF14DRAFT_1998141 [Spinellus fusiger]
MYHTLLLTLLPLLLVAQISFIFQLILFLLSSPTSSSSPFLTPPNITTMRFSIAAVSAIVLASCATLTQADQYADAIKEWCKGLEVPYPDESAVFTAGSETKVTVKRVPDDHVKTVTGLDVSAPLQT